jgi:rubredoxin
MQARERPAPRPINHRMGTTRRKYRCRFCSHVYDENLGDPDSGISAGTLFEDIPEDWVCPECGAAKSDYELIEE